MCSMNIVRGYVFRPSMQLKDAHLSSVCENESKNTCSNKLEHFIEQRIQNQVLDACIPMTSFLFSLSSLHRFVSKFYFHVYKSAEVHQQFLIERFCDEGRM